MNVLGLIHGAHSESGPSAKLRTALTHCEPVVQHYVAKLEAMNTALQEEIAALELKVMSTNNRVKALEKERRAHDPPKPADMGDAARRVAFVLSSAGMCIVDAKGKKVRALNPKR